MSWNGKTYVPTIYLEEDLSYIERKLLFRFSFWKNSEHICSKTPFQGAASAFDRLIQRDGIEMV